MPSVACEDYRILRVGVLDDIVCLLPDLGFDALSPAVELAQFLRKRGGFVFVPAHEEPGGDARLTESARGVEARDEREGKGIGCDGAQVGTGNRGERHVARTR